MPNKTFHIKEYGYLLKGEGQGHGFNYCGIPETAFKYLLSYLQDESKEGFIESFIKLTTYKRQVAIKVQNYVGVVQSPCGAQIEILPKIYSQENHELSVENVRAQLLKMLRTLRDSPFKEADRASLHDAKMPLLEIYISQFLGLVGELIKRGVRSDYIQVRKNVSFLKGRLLVAEQLRRNTHHPEHFYTQYQEYQFNRPANRLIKTTLELIRKRSSNSHSQRLAREYGFVFDEVPKSIDVKQDFQQVKTDRSMGHYKDVLSWCKILLKGYGPTASAGDFSALTLLYPMERVFEDYVAHCLGKSIGEYIQDADGLKTQVRKKYLVESHQGKSIFSLRPDFMATKNGEPLMVMDAKWKLLDQKNRKNKYGISQADMYQLYAYGNKYLASSNNKEVMLIYPRTHAFTEPLEIFNYEEGFRLNVLPFDVMSGALISSRVLSSGMVNLAT